MEGRREEDEKEEEEGNEAKEKAEPSPRGEEKHVFIESPRTTKHLVSFRR